MKHTIPFAKKLGSLLVVSIWPLSMNAQIFVTSSTGSISEYNMSGSLVNASVVSGLDDPDSITSDGAGTLFVTGNGSLAAYTVGGNLVWQYPTLQKVSGTIWEPMAVTYSDGNLFVEDNEEQDPYSENPSEYLWTLNAATGSGATLVASSFQNMTGQLAASGNSWYFSVFNGYAGGIASSVGTFASGTYFPQSLALDDQGDLFVANVTGGTIAKYDASTHQLLDSTLITLNYLDDLAVVGNDLFVSYDGNSTIAEYTTSGQLVNATLITGLSNVTGFTVVPEPTSLTLVLIGSAVCIRTCKKKRAP